MSSHLTAEQRALLEIRLTQRQAELEHQLNTQLGGSSRTEHARDVLTLDGDDSPARAADREVDLARSDQEIDEMRAVQAALKRVHAPDFGYCVECGTQIPFDRLQHHPAVLRCVTCQANTERKQGGVRPARL